MKKYIFILVSLILIVSLFAEILQEQEKELFNKLMENNDLDSGSVNFLKDWASDTKYKIPQIVDIINNPFHFPDFAQELKNILEQEKQSEILGFCSETIFEEKLPEMDSHLQYCQDFLAEISKPKEIFKYVQSTWMKACEENKQIYVQLDDGERTLLDYFATTVHSESSDSLRYKAYFKQQNKKEDIEIDLETISPIIDKIDFAKIMEVAAMQQIAFEQLRSFIQKQDWKIAEPITFDSPWGKMVIGSNSDDLYTEKYCLIIDLDGNDRYQAELATSYLQPFYWLIDLAGNDTYDNSSIRGLLSSVTGFGYSYDGDGDDLYQLGDLALSAFFGYNQHQDYCGDDTYRLGLHSAGAASFGIALLQDDLGDDIYSISELGQGFGGTKGMGILFDRDGDDLYFAGGKYLHEPLAPYDHRSLGQGFGYGMRPDFAGGIGVLADQAGNDRYDGGVYAQGVGYWYALGLLLDDEGNDYYNAVYYPQGSGIHLAGGLLYDGEGEDSYYSKHGPGQGAGHDYGVGFLIDRKGDDVYSVEGGNGLGISNSVGVFIDSRGNDRYERNNSSNYGVGKMARGSGSIGLFIDKGGVDIYANGNCGDNTEWNNGKYGLGGDYQISNPLRSIQKDSLERAAQVDSLAEISEIFKIASGWGVGNNGERVKKAGDILLSRDSEAAKYIAENQMRTKSGLTFRAISTYAKKSESFSDYFDQLLSHSDSLIVKNCIALVAVTSQEQYLPRLNQFLVDGKYINSILSAFGNIKSDQSVDILSEYINHKSEKIRVIAARSLKDIGSEKSMKILRSMSGDSSFLIRSMVDNLKPPKDNNLIK